MAMPKSFSPVRKYVNNLNPKTPGFLLSMKLSGLSGSLSATTKTKTVNGAQVEYQAYSLLGTVTGADGGTRRINASLNHLIAGPYANVVLKDAEGNVVQVSDLDDMDRTAVTRADGTTIDGLNTVVGVTAEVTMVSDDPQDVVILKTPNGVAIYTVIVSAPAASEDDFAALEAEFAGSGSAVLEAQN